KVTVDDKHTHTVSVRYTEEYRAANGFTTEHCKIHVAALVLEAFKGPKPSSRHKACHKNDNPADNRLENLYWGTEREQSLDRQKNRGSNHRPKAIHVNPWVYDALRQYHRESPIGADLPSDHCGLAENILRLFLDERWAGWRTWVDNQRAS